MQWCLGGTLWIYSRPSQKYTRVNSRDTESFGWQRAADTCAPEMLRDKQRLPENTLHPSFQKAASNKAVKIHPGSPVWREREGWCPTFRQQDRQTDRRGGSSVRVRHVGLSWSYWCSVDFGTSASPFVNCILTHTLGGRDKSGDAWWTVELGVLSSTSSPVQPACWQRSQLLNVSMVIMQPVVRLPALMPGNIIYLPRKKSNNNMLPFG